MPKRTDIEKILIIGSGPIVIGQACEFDYSGTQACKALREEGYKVVLVNSNPATIMTDPEIADATYIEPLTAGIIELILEKERPQAILPTMGGQTALNLAVELSMNGTLERFGVELIGAKLESIRKAEDRWLFRQSMKSIGLEVPESAVVCSLEEGFKRIEEIGFPAILRPAFTLGGTGGGIVYNMEEYGQLLEKGLKLSLNHQVLVEESVLGWKEYELEVMRDMHDNVVIICSIENFDPMGVHTGDSITVAPAQTLTDREYQRMRNAAMAIIREIGVDTGGSNIQFALHPETGRMVVIEMNPRVSRSSALASKATGFPIAKIAAKLAVGLALNEIPNSITRETPASFEPAIDYVVTKIPRFAFEKFPEADPLLTTQMKSVGEVMAIGRTFKESLQKAIRSLETGSFGFEEEGESGPEKNMGPDSRKTGPSEEDIAASLKKPNPARLYTIADALRGSPDRRKFTVKEIHGLTGIDPWFLENIREITDAEEKIKAMPEAALREEIEGFKGLGFSDMRLSRLAKKTEAQIRGLRKELGLRAAYKMVDTCSAEFQAFTPYLYSTWEKPFYAIGEIGRGAPAPQCEASPSGRKKVIILGSGPNRIGQGIEFDYCCVHAVFALKELGYETIMVNCNPETVSTDYDTADRLYFEPLTIEDVMNIIEVERPEGVIVQFGGQTPLKLAIPLEQEGVRIMGTSPDAIDRAEDRRRFRELLEKLGLRQPQSYTASSVEEALTAAARIGYPVMVRPSYVLGGQAMEIVYDDEALASYMQKAVTASPDYLKLGPVLIDKYLECAVEVDVDAVSDGSRVFIGGVMEHIEEAGIHSGDSACSIPPYSLDREIVEEIERQTRALALELRVVGLMNVQFAIKDRDVYILEVNPRASRTIPFVSKATGVPLAKVAAKLMAGATLEELGLADGIRHGKKGHVAVKEAVFPFDRFYGVDPILGPEMKSTGEVMGIDRNFGLAFAKAQSASGNGIPVSGKIFFSLRDKDKPASVALAKKLAGMGFGIVATRGTAEHLTRHGVMAVECVNKLTEGRPNVLDLIKNRELSFIVNTISDARAHKDSFYIRQNAMRYGVPYTTTISGAGAVVEAVESLKAGAYSIRPLQEYNAE
ncbi:MAG: carbamoyl-phosphate synthase large subunit [Nitrospiraceae bacterium]|nr:carbamoyl-phosphate synthase large subunit [Nitrospiraceae bacterium]